MQQPLCSGEGEDFICCHTNRKQISLKMGNYPGFSEKTLKGWIIFVETTLKHCSKAT